MAMHEYHVHPIAKLIPEADEATYAALKADIARDGQRQPIILFEGMVLDGRARLRACIETHRKAMTANLTGTEESALAHLIASNLVRRHLTPAQRAAIAVALLGEERKRARQRMLSGRADPPEDGGEGCAGEAVVIAGKRLGVSGESVRRAARIGERAPEVLEALRDGVLASIPEAEKCVSLPTDVRRDVLARVKAEGGKVADAIGATTADGKTPWNNHPPKRVEVTEPTYRLIYGVHVHDALRNLPDQSVHIACTSPPYFCQRDYSIGSVSWADGWEGQLGLEPTIDQYVQHLVEVLSKVRRVLRHDGTMWINVGDKYIDGHLAGVPWRVALALRDDGWVLRRDIIWEKPNFTPESAKCRPTGSHEYVFMLAKQKSGYYYDWGADTEPMIEQVKAGLDESNLPDGAIPGRNLRSVWRINVQPTDYGHLAPWPEVLVERMVLLGTSEHGACPTCGAPWRRVTERPTRPTDGWKRGRNGRDGGLTVADGLDSNGMSHGAHSTWLAKNPHVTTGWKPTCQCDDNDASGRCVVLDPFSGSGTTGQVAVRHGRDYIGIDLDSAALTTAELRIRESSTAGSEGGSLSPSAA